MPTCVSIVRKYGHLQKFPLQSAEVFLVVSSPPRICEFATHDPNIKLSEIFMVDQTRMKCTKLIHLTVAIYAFELLLLSTIISWVRRDYVWSPSFSIKTTVLSGATCLVSNGNNISSRASPTMKARQILKRDKRTGTVKFRL